MENKESDLITLNDSLLIGEGGSRNCYVHPDDENLCIKTIKKKSDQRSVDREVGYFKRMKKREQSFKMIAKYYHSVQTSEGRGEVYELVRDYNGEISKDLKYYLDLKDKNINQKIIKLIEDLRVYLKNENIRFSDLCSHNVLLKKVDENNYEMVVIDGIGDNNQIPLLEYVSFLGIKRSMRKWEKFRLELVNEFGCKEKDINHFIKEVCE